MLGTNIGVVPPAAYDPPHRTVVALLTERLRCKAGMRTACPWPLCLTPCRRLCYKGGSVNGAE